MTAADVADAAIAYAEGGWAIFPLHHPTAIGRCSCSDRNCQNQGKHPRTRHGSADATTDTTTVAAWWSRWPTANIGLTMTNGVFVIDIDPHKGGEDTWTELTANGGQIWTRTTLSGRGDGSRHLWLRHPGITMRGSLGVGIEVKRIATEYVVAPPSIHAATLQPYRWADPATPIALPPTWLVSELAERVRPVAPFDPDSKAHSTEPLVAWSYGGWNPAGLLEVMSTATEGCRNARLFWCAARIGDDVAAGKVPEHRALAVLDQLAETAEQTGLPPLEVERTIRSGYRR